MDDKLRLKYELAYDVLKNKLASINKIYSVLGPNNPIEYVDCRIKKDTSITEKLIRDGIEPTSENIEYYLNDVVGARIVCSFLNDIKELIDIIRNDKEIKIEKVKDFITYPNQNNYQSYHMIVSISTYLGPVKAEIQIRTIAMHMIASLEHKISYKKDVELSIENREKLEEVKMFSRLVDTVANNIVKKRKENPQKTVMELPDIINEKEYEKLMLKYQMALETIETKMKYIKNEYNLSEKDEQGEVNPIEHIKTRLKSKEKTITKLIKKGYPVTLENISAYINDVAGIRIVCSFKSDVSKIIDIINSDKDLCVFEKNDHITYPKDNGYQSYDLLVFVPIKSRDGIIHVKVEIQIRTIAMEMWASLEHKLCYQKEVDESIKDTLRKQAKDISKVDNEMEELIRDTRNLLSKKEKTKKLKLKLREKIPQN